MRRRKNQGGNNNNYYRDGRDNNNSRDRDKDRDRDRDRDRDKDRDRDANRGNVNRDSRDSNPNSVPNKNNPQFQQQQFEEYCVRMEKLRDNYLRLRKRFFESSHKFDSAQKSKAEQEIFNALKGLRRFEEFISKQHKYLSKKNMTNYALDNTYATYLKNLDDQSQTIGTTATTGTGGQNSSQQQLQQQLQLQNFSFNDLHLIPDQLNRPSYKNDREESSGSMEDYQKHKIEKKSK
ncbi:MAG: hypothetical protein HQK49_05725 [Oligoflexia bacterium]|nr:hypothetical protein [Oligoflexia bacterium]